MSAGPWVVRFEDIIGTIEVYNTKTHEVLGVWHPDGSDKAAWKLAKRIAERLNRTEGDER